MSLADDFLFLTRKPMRALLVLVALEQGRNMSQKELRSLTGLGGGTFHNHLTDFLDKGFISESNQNIHSEQQVYNITELGVQACIYLRKYLDPTERGMKSSMNFEPLNDICTVSNTDINAVKL